MPYSVYAQDAFIGRIRLARHPAFRYNPPHPFDGSGVLACLFLVFLFFVGRDAYDNPEDITLIRHANEAFDDSPWILANIPTLAMCEADLKKTSAVTIIGKLVINMSNVLFLGAARCTSFCVCLFAGQHIEFVHETTAIMRAYGDLVRFPVMIPELFFDCLTDVIYTWIFPSRPWIVGVLRAPAALHEQTTHDTPCAPQEIK